MICQRPGFSFVCVITSRLPVARAPFASSIHVTSTICQQKLIRSFSSFKLFQRLATRRRYTCGVATEHSSIATEEMTVKDTPKEIFLRDYKPVDYAFETVGLQFVLGETRTTVVSSIRVVPSRTVEGQPLVLDGRDVKLMFVKINGEEAKDDLISITDRHLILKSLPLKPFTLEIGTEIHPETNLSLEGLYKSSSGNFCTQCEAEGFRKITFYQDRPDVMAKFTTRIEALKEKYPVLLSNGNLIEQGDLENGFHYAVWEDPFKKPCYLFALVAGPLVSRDDTFTTCSGKEVKLRIWTPAEDIPKTIHAMDSLKAAMKWDEDMYGLEYDLNLFNIVAIPDFNMGAMENKSLNIFNSKLVLASPETATDGDYAAILGVIGHEYFHNWTGNRVTCRDWFQLSLKEGLTVYRDQEFSSDMGCRPVKRIGDVALLRTAQFSEDAGPMAHPVRPHSYIKMDNFYTVTVYEKGAEVVRMYETLLGKDGFRKGMDLYFQRHDGQAVTCEEFFAAMRDANDTNLSTFLRWYSQAGTPVLTVKTSYNAEAKTYTLKCKQEVPPTPGQPVKEPALIPLAVGLLDSKGHDIQLSSVFDGEVLKELNGLTTVVLRVEKDEQEFIFMNINEKPVPSLLRNFSAPVRLVAPDVTDEELLFLLAHDSDAFNRWEAGQTIARKLILDLVAKAQKNDKLTIPNAFIEGIRSILNDSSLDKEFAAKAITLPGESELMDLMEVADPDAVHLVRRLVIKELATNLKDELLHVVSANRTTDSYVFDHENKARRALKNTALVYLATLDDVAMKELAAAEFKSATNMTDQFAALAAIAQNPGHSRDEALSSFYEQWKHDPLVVNKWLALQAMSDIPENVNSMRLLLDHPAFDIKNPNKVYSLVGAFVRTPVNFHAKDGSGYEFLGDIVMKLDKMNPQVASRMVTAFSRWKRFDERRQSLSKSQLERIVKAEGLSENVFEIASKSLAS